MAEVIDDMRDDALNEMANEASGGEKPKGKFPAAIWYIVGNEAAERFNYYGFKAVLTTFLAMHFFGGDLTKPASDAANVAASGQANALTHSFIALNYTLPLIGGLLADWFLGKYRTIFYLSIVYCLGNICLALFSGGGPTTVADPQLTFFTIGLFLIALGSGGIKPCVSANVGDQFDKSNEHLMSRAFGLFYMSINFGSMISITAIPFIYDNGKNPELAFGLPGFMMLLATIVFFLGRKKYKRIPPKGDKNKAVVLACVIGSFLALYSVMLFVWDMGVPLMLVMWLAACIILAFVFWKQWTAAPGNFIGANLYQWTKGKGAAALRYSPEAIEGNGAVWNVLKVFAFIPVFWALYDMNGSEWVLQAQRLDTNIFGLQIPAESVQMVNAALILILTPIMTGWLYPTLEKKFNIKVTHLRKFGVGFAFTALAFVVTIIIENMIAAGQTPSMWWQVLAYFILTIGEVLISITGLEYAYTYSPPTMKSTIMACWLLTVAVGNVITTVINEQVAAGGLLEGLHGANFYLLFIGLMAVNLVLFILIAPMIKGKKYVG